MKYLNLEQIVDSGGRLLFWSRERQVKVFGTEQWEGDAGGKWLQRGLAGSSSDDEGCCCLLSIS